METTTFIKPRFAIATQPLTGALSVRVTLFTETRPSSLEPRPAVALRLVSKVPSSMPSLDM
jgi:hypothetical protein